MRWSGGEFPEGRAESGAQVGGDGDMPEAPAHGGDDADRLPVLLGAYGAGGEVGAHEPHVARTELTVQVVVEPFDYVVAGDHARVPRYSQKMQGSVFWWCSLAQKTASGPRLRRYTSAASSIPRSGAVK